MPANASHGSSSAAALARDLACTSHDAVAHELAHQRVLVGEVAVDGPHPDAGVRRDVVDLRRLALLGDDRAGGADDLLAVAAGVGAQRALGRVVTSVVAMR